MMDTLELTLDLTPSVPWSDIMIAELAELGFDGFIVTETGIQAYRDAGEAIEGLLKKTSLFSEGGPEFKWKEKRIPHQNWNAQWEADFHPVEVEKYATIVAPFHDRKKAGGMIVEIQPQMSFGTGHHQTTWMMTKALFELDAMPDRVLDMGTGTGVLAIIAERLGAKRILAIDVEEGAYENALENAERNNAKRIECRCGDIDLLGGERFGLIVANINKNILRGHMEQYGSALVKNGTLLLSGFFDSDVDELITFAQQFDLTYVSHLLKDEWACVKLKKTTD